MGMGIGGVDGAAAVASPDRDRLDLIGRGQFLQQEDETRGTRTRRVIEVIIWRG